MMWVVVEQGEVFEGEADEFRLKFMDASFDEAWDCEPELAIRSFCDREGWTVRVHASQHNAWN